MNEVENKSNLVRTNTLVYKIKRFFTNLFSGRNKEIIQPIEEEIENNNIILQEQVSVRKEFMKQLQPIEEQTTEKLVLLLKKNKMTVEELTEEQKQEVIIFLQEEISSKRKKLQNFKNERLYNRLKNSKDINSILQEMPENDKLNFIAFLKQLIGKKKEKLEKLNLQTAKKSST